MAIFLQSGKPIMHRQGDPRTPNAIDRPCVAGAFRASRSTSLRGARNRYGIFLPSVVHKSVLRGAPRTPNAIDFRLKAVKGMTRL